AADDRVPTDLVDVFALAVQIDRIEHGPGDPVAHDEVVVGVVLQQDRVAQVRALEGVVAHDVVQRVVRVGVPVLQRRALDGHAVTGATAADAGGVAERGAADLDVAALLDPYAHALITLDGDRVDHDPQARTHAEIGHEDAVGRTAARVRAGIVGELAVERGCDGEIGDHHVGDAHPAQDLPRRRLRREGRAQDGLVGTRAAQVDARAQGDVGGGVGRDGGVQVVDARWQVHLVTWLGRGHGRADGRGVVPGAIGRVGTMVEHVDRLPGRRRRRGECVRLAGRLDQPGCRPWFGVGVGFGQAGRQFLDDGAVRIRRVDAYVVDGVPAVAGAVAVAEI